VNMNAAEIAIPTMSISRALISSFVRRGRSFISNRILRVGGAWLWLRLIQQR